MSDGRPAPRPTGDGALPGFAALSAPARERALADVVAARANELAREARRVVRAYDIAPVDRAAALDAVATVQRALLRDIATGRRVLDPRSWVPTVRTESERAVRRASIQQSLSVAPYRQRLAAQRATLLAVRQDAARGVPVVPVAAPAEALPAGPAESTPGGAAASAAHGLLGRAPRSRAVPRGGARHARGPSTPHAHHVTARRTLRWGAAALLSSVTILAGAAVAPAEERPAGTSDMSFVDRLTLPLVSLWDAIVPGGTAQTPAVPDDAVSPQDVEEPGPVETTTPSPAPTPAPAAPVAPDKSSPVVPAVPAPPVGTPGPGVPQDGHRGHDGRRERDDGERRGDGHEGRDARDGREREDDDENGRDVRGGDDRRRDGHDGRSGSAGNDRDRWTRDQPDRARG